MARWGGLLSLHHFLLKQRERASRIQVAGSLDHDDSPDIRSQPLNEPCQKVKRVSIFMIRHQMVHENIKALNILGNRCDLLDSIELAYQ
jgi:hypothetical protein